MARESLSYEIMRVSLKNGEEAVVRSVAQEGADLVCEVMVKFLEKKEGPKKGLFDTKFLKFKWGSINPLHTITRIDHAGRVPRHIISEAFNKAEKALKRYRKSNGISTNPEEDED